MSSAGKPELLIEVYTDPMCPWCWCGAAQLEKTLKSEDFKEKIAPFMRPEVKLRPYLLDPRLPATGFEPPSDRYQKIESTSYQKGKPPSKREYYSTKFTSLEAFDAKISGRAAELGLPPFQWLTEGKVGATWMTQRLLWKALQKQEQDSDGSIDGVGIQERMSMRMYEAFHNQSEDLSDLDVLARLGVEVGVFDDEAEAKRWFESDEGEYEVRHALDMAEMNGVQSVPFTIVQDGADHSSEVLDHAALMRMFDMQAAAYR